jgi:hypothetical protein
MMPPDMQAIEAADRDFVPGFASGEHERRQWGANLMSDTGAHKFVPKKMQISVWGMDANNRAFVDTMTTVQIAEKAAEVNTQRQLKIGEILGAGAHGMKSRVRVASSKLVSKDTYRVQLEDLGNTCMWANELANPDQAPEEKKERRKHKRWPVRGTAVLHNRDRTSTSRARLVDVSLGGFYVETLAPLSAGASAEITLECNQLLIDTKVRVCTSHPSIGMGVQIEGFASSEDEQRFQKLLNAAEIGEANA